MKNKRLTILLLLTIVSSCAVLKEPQINKHDEVTKYSFIVLPDSSNFSASSGRIYGNEHGVYGNTSSKEINPSIIIEGILLKKGLISTNRVTPENKDKTLIVKYGESGRRDIAGGLGGYTLEVTIVLVSATKNQVIYSCVAEGQGATEVDDIREAIHRCLSGL